MPHGTIKFYVIIHSHTNYLIRTIALCCVRDVRWQFSPISFCAGLISCATLLPWQAVSTMEKCFAALRSRCVYVCTCERVRAHLAADQHFYIVIGYTLMEYIGIKRVLTGICFNFLESLARNTGLFGRSVECNARRAHFLQEGAINLELISGSRKMRANRLYQTNSYRSNRIPVQLDRLKCLFIASVYST